ncbi:MAG: efflux RND transporter periplasmic adaptor subunit [Pseudomonadales bacterium]|nr:efflux RND transporter periplasmic adaptor subunit [Pseudomonadales bacterium]
MNRIAAYGLVLAVGVALGAASVWFGGASPTSESTESSGSETPLYWVAPMDPNYKRDAPGKSPMGMDLVPVYPGDLAGKGVVRISPAVAHNMGVRTGVVRRGRLDESIRSVGFVQLDEEKLLQVYPRAEGWLTAVYVDSVGDEVKAGEPLYEMYSPQLIASQQELISALAGGSKPLIDAARERLKALAVPTSLVEAVTRDRKVRERVRFVADANGIVTALSAREGRYVMPSTQMMELASLDPVWVTAEVFEREAGDVRVGDPVEFRFAGSAQPVMASVDFIYPILDAMQRTLRVRASVPNVSGTLLPNMLADARIDVSDSRQALLVPREALIRTGSGDRVVLSEGDGEYRSVSVEVGRVGDHFVEIARGLGEGDTVVTSAQFLIDSESSKTADLKRMQASTDDGMSMDGSMDHGAMDHGAMDHGSGQDGLDHSDMNMSGKENADVVSTAGVIRSIDSQARTVSVSHEPIAAWQWPAMTMTMDVDPSVDLSKVQVKGRYTLHLKQSAESSTGYMITRIGPDGE